jgi:D-alanyl-D-alanine carboxypeptidase/D-alanyl-D-alanine-endopeptidase (penicillin-binding protein 4)
MRKTFILICTICATVFSAYSQRPLEQLWQKIDTLPATRHAQIGFVCRNTATGKTVAELAPHKTYTPASVTKVVTTATILDMLGADFKFQTWIEYDGTIDAEGTLNGNIYVRGEGDPTIGSSYFRDSLLFLKKWRAEVAKLGIKKINGSIVAETGLYDDIVVSPLWMGEDIGTYYGAGVYALSCYDNTEYVTVNTKNGNLSLFRITPKLNDTDTLQCCVNVSRRATKNDVYLAGEPGLGTRFLRGELRPYLDNMTFKCDIANPPLLLVNSFKKELESAGIKVQRACSVARTNGSGNRQPIYIHLSPTLSEIIRSTNVNSNNNFAEHLFKHLALQNDSVASFERSAENLLKYWKGKGIDTSAAFMYDGSGLTPKNAFSPDFIVDILSYMKNNSNYAEAFFKSLPVAGKEGTVANLLNNFAAQNAFHVKSGSFRNVQCYAGYFTKNGQTYAFCIMVNNFYGQRAKIRQIIEEILKETYSQTNN